MIKYFILFSILFTPILASAEDAAIAAIFSRKGVDGTIVISSLNSAQTFIHNDTRARLPFSPASTFKIMNTLIAVEEKVVSGPGEVFKWDGHIYDIPDWNHDQTLADAFRVSCVWCYQKLAQQIGEERYRSYLEQSGYGELQKHFNTTTFWLDGSLQISALEQVHFLKNVVRHRLPFNKAAYDTLRQIMLLENTPAYSLWAKTGWSTRIKPQVGWYVGYVETPEDTWFFALNMETRGVKDLPLRQELALAALQSKGIIKQGTKSK